METTSTINTPTPSTNTSTHIHIRPSGRIFIVACDGSDDSKLAVERTCELASPVDKDRIILVTSVPRHHRLFAKKHG